MSAIAVAPVGDGPHPRSLTVTGARAVARSALLPVSFLVMGALWPTSVGGVIIVPLAVAHTLVAAIVFVYLGLRGGHLGTGFQVWLAASIVAFVIAASALSPFAEWAPGAVVGYVAMAGLFALDLRALTPARSMAPALLVGSGVVVSAGIGVVAAAGPVVAVIVSAYATGYPELVEFMTFARKPVFTFGSHSVAGFFYFLLFYLNLETARALHARRHLLMAVALVVLGFFLTSVTAAILMSVAIAMLLTRSGPHRWLVLGLVVVAGVIGAVLVRDRIDDLTVLAQLANTFDARESGLSGRYASGGNLVSNLRYIAERPLRPVGLTFSPTLFYGDSGPIEYLTRGSLPLLVAVYGALTAFVFRSLHRARHTWTLLAVVLAFEAGFTILTYHRFYFLVAFTVIYLNHLDRSVDGVGDGLSASRRGARAPGPE